MSGPPMFRYLCDYKNVLNLMSSLNVCCEISFLGPHCFGFLLKWLHSVIIFNLTLYPVKGTSLAAVGYTVILSLLLILVTLIFSLKVFAKFQFKSCYKYICIRYRLSSLWSNFSFGLNSFLVKFDFLLKTGLGDLNHIN